MPTYIALLRGINVSGQKIIPMSVLRELCTKLGYSDVTTYIQSGNIVFTSDQKPSSIQKSIKETIAKKFKFDVDIFVYTIGELKKIVVHCPYDESNLSENEKIHFTLFSGLPDKQGIEKLKSIGDADEFTIAGRSMYLLTRNGYGNSRFNNVFVEKTLSVRATSRNFNTMKKLIEMGEALR